MDPVRTGVLSGVFLFSAAFTPLSAQMPFADDLNKSLVYLDSSAETTVPVDRFTLTFGFDSDAGSFTAASADADRIIAAIRTEIEKTGLKSVRIYKGWDMFKQAKVSTSGSGARLSLQIILEVVRFPESKLFETMSVLVDKCLEINKNIVFREVSVGLTDETRHKLGRELLQAALAGLKDKAELARDSAGGRSVKMRKIFLQQPGQAAGEIAWAANAMYDKYAPAMRPYESLSFQPGFRVQAEVSDHVTLSVSLSGVYEIAE